LGRTGEPFWQKESYDHWVRNQAEFLRIKAYIENNPVKAGLSDSVRGCFADVHLSGMTSALALPNGDPEEYPWSSAGVEKSLDAARTSACATLR